MNYKLSIAGKERSPILVHYGSNAYNPDLVLPIINSICRVKPKQGGLWTSPIDSELGWKDWNDMEQFRDCKDENSFQVVLKESAKILVIDSYSDLLAIPLRISYDIKVPDFELIAQSYDAVWLTYEGMMDTHFRFNPSLCGWDCETVLILNPNCITEILKENK